MPASARSSELPLGEPQHGQGLDGRLIAGDKANLARPREEERQPRLADVQPLSTETARHRAAGRIPASAATLPTSRRTPRR